LLKVISTSARQATRRLPSLPKMRMSATGSVSMLSSVELASGRCMLSSRMAGEPWMTAVAIRFSVSSGECPSVTIAGGPPALIALRTRASLPLPTPGLLPSMATAGQVGSEGRRAAVRAAAARAARLTTSPAR
jgi:hypothetical protein